MQASATAVGVENLCSSDLLGENDAKRLSRRAAAESREEGKMTFSQIRTQPIAPALALTSSWTRPSSRGA